MEDGNGRNEWWSVVINGTHTNEIAFFFLSVWFEAFAEQERYMPCHEHRTAIQHCRAFLLLLLLYFFFHNCMFMTSLQVKWPTKFSVEITRRRVSRESIKRRRWQLPNKDEKKNGKWKKEKCTKWIAEEEELPLAERTTKKQQEYSNLLLSILQILYFLFGTTFRSKFKSNMFAHSPDYDSGNFPSEKRK